MDKTLKKIKEQLGNVVKLNKQIAELGGLDKQIGKLEASSEVLNEVLNKINAGASLGGIKLHCLNWLDAVSKQKAICNKKAEKLIKINTELCDGIEKGN